MKRKTALFFSMLALLTSVFMSTTVRAESTALETKIDEYVKQNEETTAAMSVSVFQNDSTQLEKSYGYIDIENKRPADENTVYEFASITKLFTWVSVMQLVEQDKLDLNTDIREYLPDGFLTKLNYETPITLLNLMNHNAGWQDSVVEVNILDKKNLRSLENCLKEIQPEQIYEPGTVVAYSNYGAGLAGYIVERVSGMKFSDYVQQNIFQTLGMQHTAIAPDSSDNPWVIEQRRLEQGYTVDNKLMYPNICYDTRYPDGGIVGTMGDMVLFAKALLTPEGGDCPLFEKKETLQEFLSPSFYYGDDSGAYICHGLWSEEAAGAGVIGHGGNSYAFSAYLYLNPVNHTGAVIATNQASEAVYTHGLGGLIFGGMDVQEASPDYQFEDYYYMARTIRSGALRLYSFMETFHVTEDSAGNVEMKSPMGTGTIRWVSDTEFILPLAGYDFLCHAVSNPEQKVERIQMMSTEFLPISKETVFCQYLSIGLALLAGVYCLLMSVKNLFAGIFRHRHFQGIPFGMEVLTAGFILSLFQYIGILTPGTALLSQVKMHGILYLAYLFMGLFYLFWVFLSHRKNRLEGWLTAGAVVLVGGFILYWQLFVWWI